MRCRSIGIDGTSDWSAGGKLYTELEKDLTASDAAYLFLMTHYPVASSASHGTLDEEGHYKEKPMCVGKEVLVPLLQKYHVTAVLAGHDHCYEAQRGRAT